jgi:hypothetical protein
MTALPIASCLLPSKTETTVFLGANSKEKPDG